MPHPTRFLVLAYAGLSFAGLIHLPLQAMRMFYEHELFQMRLNTPRFSLDEMYQAAQKGPEALQTVLNQGADLNRGRITPLMWASYKREVGAVHTLLQARADPNCSDTDGKTSVHWALHPLGLLHEGSAENGVLGVVEALIEHKADVNAGDAQGDTPMLYAVELGYASVMERLVQNEVSLHQPNLKGKTPLMVAASKAHNWILRHLIEAGVAVGVVDQSGQTALHWAVLEGAFFPYRLPPLADLFPALEYLLACQADPNACNHQGATALSLAASGGHWEVVHLLLDRGAGPHGIGKNGCTALLYAVERSHFKTVQRLLEAGADLGSMDREGNSAFHYATDADVPAQRPDQRQRILELLLAYKGLFRPSIAPPIASGVPCQGLLSAPNSAPERFGLSSVNRQGVSPLVLAANRFQWEMVHLLLDAGASAQEGVNRYGRSALMLAVIDGQLAVAERLLKAGAKPNFCSKDGDTALHEVADPIGPRSEPALLAMAQLLLAYRADPQARNQAGRTPLQLANGKGSLWGRRRPQLAQYLADYVEGKVAVAGILTLKEEAAADSGLTQSVCHPTSGMHSIE